MGDMKNKKFLNFRITGIALLYMWTACLIAFFVDADRNVAILISVTVGLIAASLSVGRAVLKITVVATISCILLYMVALTP